MTSGLGRTDLETRLLEITSRARACFAGLWVSNSDYLRHLAERTAPFDGTLAGLNSLHTNDLYLACACAKQDEVALRIFVELYAPVIASQLRSLHTADAEEVKQGIAEKLFVPRASGRLGILEYAGRGELRAWIAVVATRAALSSMRGKKHEVTLGEVMLAAFSSSDDDAEQALLKATSREHFRSAFEASVKLLSAREKNLLRQHFIDGLNFEELGALYRVHRSSVSRWVASAQAVLDKYTRQELKRRLNLDAADVDSIVRLIQSRVFLSLERLL